MHLSVSAKDVLTEKGGQAIVIKNHTKVERYPQKGLPMLHILICDDEEDFASLLKEKITELPSYSRRRMSIVCITDPRDITVQLIRNMDLIFLDIDMGGVNGLQLARQLREVRKDSILIFVTNYGEYAAEGYEVNAFRFLPKLLIDEKLPDYFEKALVACQAHARTLTLICDGEETALSIDTIIYVETSSGVLIFHLDETARPLRKSRMTMRKLEETLMNEGFLRIHSSYLVNMTYIQRLLSSGAALCNGQFLSVSQHNYPEIKKKYLEWKGLG